jgi:hypothetical protein
MKNLAIKLVFILSMACMTNISAQQIKDSKGHLIMNAKGDIYFDGVKTGTVSKDKIIKDANGKKIGFINANGTLSDEKGKAMGKMGKDGKTYYNSDGVVQFTIEDTENETCNIKDAKGNVIGNVHKSLKGVACALHCFQNQMDMEKHQKHSSLYVVKLKWTFP